MQWAHIIFNSDKKRCNVPFSFIENYEQRAINIGKIYNVFWSPKPEDNPETFMKREKKILHVEKIKRTSRKGAIAGWYSATVCHIADSEEKLEEDLENERIRIPLVETNIDPVESEMETPNLQNKELLEKAKQKNLSCLFGGETDSDDDLYIPKHEIMLMRKEISDLKFKLKNARSENLLFEEKMKKLKHENACLTAELEQERKQKDKLFNINLKLQECLISKISTNAPTEAQVPSSPLIRKDTSPDAPVCKTILEELPPHIAEDPAILKSLIEPYLTLEQFKRIERSVKQGSDGDGMFVKNLASALWSPDELANRSSQGFACPTKKGEPARQECTPEKKEFIKNLLEKRIRETDKTEDVVKKRLKKMNAYLSSKITTIRRDMKNKDF